MQAQLVDALETVRQQLPEEEAMPSELVPEAVVQTMSGARHAGEDYQRECPSAARRAHFGLLGWKRGILNRATDSRGKTTSLRRRAVFALVQPSLRPLSRYFPDTVFPDR